MEKLRRCGNFSSAPMATVFVAGVSGEAFELGGDFAVVAGGARVGFAREIQARGEAEGAMFAKLGEHGRVIGVIGDDADALKIFRGGANHGGAANVDIFDQLGGGDAGRGGSGGEGIEIYDDEIDGHDAVFLRLFLVFGFGALVEDAAVNFRMERLHAAAEHFGPAGEVGDVAHGHAGLAQEFRGAAGRDDLGAERAEFAREFHDAGLVVNADESARDFRLACGARHDECLRRNEALVY